MTKLLKLVLCISAALVPLVKAENEGVINYADLITLNHQDGYWQCDTMQCPFGTFGCKIVYESSVELFVNILTRKSICSMENGFETFMSINDGIMPYNQTVKINVTSYLGALSVYGVGFSDHAQSIQGTVAPNDWHNVQKTMRNIISATNATSNPQ